MAESATTDNLELLDLSPRRPFSGAKRARSLDDDDLQDPPSSKRSKPLYRQDGSHSICPNEEDYKSYILRNLRSLWSDDTVSDVVFVVEGERHNGVRALFAAQSEVFRRMLFGSMMESVVGSEVVLHDVTVSAFKLLRSSFYGVDEELHYNEWGSSYDEWFLFKLNNAATSNQQSQSLILSQHQVLHRIAKHGAITGRKAQSQPFKDKLVDFKRHGYRRADAAESTHELQVKLPMAFWIKNQHFIDGHSRFIGQWLNAKIIGFKTATKYSDHIKVGLYINGDHYEYWVHPDNADEVRPMTQQQLPRR